MTTSAAHVNTCASACRCFDASERTSESDWCAAASIRLVILSRSQVARRVSRIAPVTGSTISSPLPRAQWTRSFRSLVFAIIDFRCRGGLTEPRGLTQPRGLTEPRGLTDRLSANGSVTYPVHSRAKPGRAGLGGQDALRGGLGDPGVDLVGHRVGELQVGDVGEQRAVAAVEELGVDVVEQPLARVPFLEVVELFEVVHLADGQELDLNGIPGQLDHQLGRLPPVLEQV